MDRCRVVLQLQRTITRESLRERERERERERIEYTCNEHHIGRPRRSVCIYSMKYYSCSASLPPLAAVAPAYAAAARHAANESLLSAYSREKLRSPLGGTRE